MQQTPLEVLDLPSTATAEEIRAKMKELIKLTHLRSVDKPPIAARREIIRSANVLLEKIRLGINL